MYRARVHKAREVLGILIPYLKKRIVPLIGVSIISFFAAAFNLISPQIIRYVVKTAIPQNNMVLVWALGGGLLGAALVGGLLEYGSRYLAIIQAQKIIFELRNDIYERLQQLSMEYYTEESTGNIMTRVTTDLNAITSFLSFTLRLLMNGVIIFVGAYTAMFLISWQLTSLLLLLFPGFIFLVIWFSKTVRPIFYAARTQFGKVTGVLQENITGYHVVRGFAQEENEIAKFVEENAKYRDLRIKGQIYRSIYFSVMTLLIGIGTSIVLYVGGVSVTRGLMDVGDFGAFIFYLLLLPMPTRQLTMIVGVFQRALASGDRLLELLKAKLEVHEDPHAIDPPRFKGEIVYENVWFGYSPDRPILKDVSVSIPSGQKVVILGGSGSGKTSFVNLIPRLYDPTKGRIMIDGVDIRKYKLKGLRKQIGIVLQETYLFNDTIKENIAFGRPDASMEEIQAAAKVAKIHDFIMSLPEGYDTPVGDRGITLSGGQQQRLSIARTLVTNPSILIFDDSVSSVDAETEAQIQEALEILSKGRTTLIISQRISSVTYADRILVFDKGQIVQDGTHEELIKQQGVYQIIYSTLAEQYATPLIQGQKENEKVGK
ncbi:MAG: ABC transporter ATP-binding protein [Candidatus Heimdallarchaeaceae archaeon]